MADKPEAEDSEPASQARFCRRLRRSLELTRSVYKPLSCCFVSFVWPSGRRRKGVQVPPLFVCEDGRDPQIGSLARGCFAGNLKQALISSLAYHAKQCQMYREPDMSSPSVASVLPVPPTPASDTSASVPMSPVWELCESARKVSSTEEAAKSFERHVANGHLPFRRDCATCLRGQLSSRPHRRISCPDSYVLSLDFRSISCWPPRKASKGKVFSSWDPHNSGVGYGHVKNRCRWHRC